MEGEREKRLLE
jgi:hypothetical protein